MSTTFNTSIVERREIVTIYKALADPNNPGNGITTFTVPIYLTFIPDELIVLTIHISLMALKVELVYFGPI